MFWDTIRQQTAITVKKVEQQKVYEVQEPAMTEEENYMRYIDVIRCVSAHLGR